PPDIISDDSSADLHVPEGDNATLHCKATGHPTPRVTWRREGGEPILLRRGTKELFHGESGGSQLSSHLMTTFPATAVGLCQSLRLVGLSLSRPAHSITGLPLGTALIVAKDTGDDGRMGDPTDAHIFEETSSRIGNRLFKAISPGGQQKRYVSSVNSTSLTFWKTDRQMMGAFLCIASNEVPPAVSRRVQLNINFAPHIEVPNQLLGAPLGTDVKLECNVEAFPNTINFWLKSGQEMLLDGPKYKIGEQRKNYKVFMSLLIHSFREDDIGVYNCISTNSLGRAEGTVRLYVIKPVGESPLSNRVVNAGEPELIVYLCGNLSKITDFKAVRLMSLVTTQIEEENTWSLRSSSIRLFFPIRAPTIDDVALPSQWLTQRGKDRGDWGLPTSDATETFIVAYVKLELFTYKMTQENFVYVTCIKFEQRFPKVP
ncbi:Hemicentin-1, partial [Frankliniella fusca]